MPIVLAHRARSGPEPENTLEALEATKRRGVPGVEFDVRRTSDGALVIAHDDELAGLLIADSSLAELRERHPALATFSEFLEAAGPEMLLDVELKEEGFEAEVVEALRARGGPSAITSFRDASVARVKRARPEQRAGLLLGVRASAIEVGTRMSELFPLVRVAAAGADFVAPNHRLLRLGFVRRMWEAGVPIWVWTVDREADLRRHLASSRIEALITDRPMAALSILAEDVTAHG